MASINASPTKEFFISIITKDISLLDAIKDLVDNCVDGALSLKGNHRFDGLFVHIEVKPDCFLIVDNCGGISVDTATNYAFRFGRAKGAPSVEGSIGQFGVGMKRALFKMGKKFEVKSTAADSSFVLDIDIDHWTSLKDEHGHEKWEFEFKEATEGEINPENGRGTTLQVTQLYASISAEFGTDLFVQQLVTSLQQAHAQSLDRGLDIKVNNFELSHQVATLLTSESIRPIRLEKSLMVEIDSNEVLVKLTIYAGISESNLKEAGWYIICNGRQVLGADKTSLTGWSSRAEGEASTPGAHGQFSRFRGYAVFESDNAKALPWNTSKSGIDADSKAYQVARMEMINAIRQVADFLNDVDAERDTESTFLQDHISEARPTNLSCVPSSSKFSAPQKIQSLPKPNKVRVQFSQDAEDVEFARKHFAVGSASKAGEAAFNYFLIREREG